MSKRYNVSEVEELGRLISNKVGYYNELLVLNYTSFDIAVVDHNNDRHVIPGCPIYTGITNEVLIENRKTMAQTKPTDYGPTLVFPGVRVVVSENDLSLGPVYISELNIVIASARDSMTVKHPYGCVDYTQAALRANLKFEQAAEESILVSITANDPTGSLKELYTGVGDSIIKIPVQHEIEACVTPQLVYAIRDPDGLSRVMTIDISTLSDKDKVLYTDNSIIKFVTLDEDEANIILKNYKTYSVESVNKRVEQVKDEYEKKLAAMKHSHETEKVVMESNIKRLKDVILDKDHQITTLESKYNSLLGTYQYMDAQLERKREVEISENKKRISDHNVDIAETKSNTTRRESEYKLWYLIAAAAAPIVTGCIGVLIKKWME